MFKITLVYSDDHFVEVWADGTGQATGIIYDALSATRAGSSAAATAKHIEINPFADPPHRQEHRVESPDTRKLPEKLEDELRSS